MTPFELTRRQQEIMDAIRGFTGEHGYPPTVRDIGKAVGLTSSSTVHAHLANLEKLGLLRRDPTKPRAMELVDRATRGVKGFVSGPGLPVVGHVAAGSPTVAEELIEDHVEVPQQAGGRDGQFVLRVRGDSMIDAGILDGDLVVVAEAKEARDGEIVVALVGEDSEATVKRFFKDGKKVRLEAENKAYKPIITDQVQLVGRVVGLMRDVR
ncbi:MAG: transcriptional repressor LexA [Actinomycetes bacterium]|nr:transcriptional repressor LexA [Solirubrobacterales bacterium]